MKQLMIKSLILLTLIFSAGCSEEFLEVENKNNLTEGSFYKTKNDFQLALNSCYTPLAGRGMYGLRFQFLFGTWEDRTLFETEGRDNLAVMNSGNGDNRQMYLDMYFGLYRTSRLLRELAAAGDIEGMDADSRDQIEAETRALRAMYYFYLVVVYNRPVYYDEVDFPVDFNQNFTNGDPIQFWDKLEEDLDFAIPILPESYPDADVGRITTGAASSLLGKALLFKYYHFYAKNGNQSSGEASADLGKARDTFLDVMNSGTYDLVYPKAPKTRKDYLMALLSNTAYLDLQSENNTYPSENNIESIWEVQYSNTRIAGGWLPGWMWSGSMNSQWFSIHSNSYKNHEVHPDWFYSCDSVGAPGGFDRDPRAYASVYINGDTMHIDPDASMFKKYNSFINTKRIANSRGLTRPEMDGLTEAFGMKKYYFPVYDEAGTSAPNNDPVNRNVIRYADVLLMYAEVMFLLGDDGTGLSALNEVRGRVDMPPVPALTAEAIIHERDVELAFETHRWLDLIRWSFDNQWGIDWDALLGPGIFKVGKNEYMPIPIGEIDVNNGALQQNPGW